MTLVRRRDIFPFDLFRVFRDDAFFDSFFGKEAGSLLKYDSGDLPTNIYETDKEWVYEVAAAGYSENDLRVEVKDDKVLTVHIQKTRSDEEDGKSYSHKGIAARKYLRRWTFSDTYDPTKSKVSFKDGLLTVRVPKVPLKENLKVLDIKTK